MIPSELLSAVQALWRAGPLHWDKLYAMAEFEALKDVCVRHYRLRDDKIGLQSSLAEVLQAAGAPFFRTRDLGVWASDADAVASLIDTTLRQRRAIVRHICPLNFADDLPHLRFGNAELRRFSADELRVTFEEWKLRRYPWIASVDWGKYAEFQWLIVTDEQSLPAEPGERSIPILYQRFDRDFGEIDPHKTEFPPALNDVIFFLASAPWQEWTSWTDFDWHPFKFPWHYKTSTDLLERPLQPQSHDTLGWEPFTFPDRDGEIVEIDRPIVYPLAKDDEIARTLSSAAWEGCRRARGSPVFVPPVAHFLIKGFLGEGIEEFLAHITTIEACLGAAEDHVRKGRKDQRHKDLMATARVAARIVGLLGATTAADAYKDLFKIRSEYLHGSWTGTIASDKRVLARHIAQQVVAKLIEHGASPDGSMPRQQFLSELLDRGSPNT